MTLGALTLVGVFALLGIAFLLSENRRAISLRTVLGAFAIQAMLGIFVLYVPAGKSMLLGLSEGVQAVMSSANVGMDFLFGGW